ncbi:MAG: hypothetical protein QM730_21695 [Anaerolineales bacterium]
MNAPHTYEIHIEGQLNDLWTDWFDGLVIQNHEVGETILTGRLADQAALLGVLNKIHSLNITLISISRLPDGKSTSYDQ